MHAFDPVPGQVETLEPGLRRVLAPNPSPMTFRGTNTYILGEGEVAVIDPGPRDPAHFAALTAALAGERVSHILVTHAHLDHSALAPDLSRATGAPVLAFGDALAGRSTVMAGLAARGLARGGEGVDTGFLPVRRLADGERIGGAGWSLEALWTPGHFGNHLCFAWGDAIFTGDLVMGWASSLVSPPDGDIADYMASCARLRSRPARVLHSGHGAPVTDPAGRLEWLVAHRRSREAQILDALAAGPLRARSLTRALYAGTPQTLLPAAERNVFAHLVDLVTHGRAAADPDLALASLFSLRT